MTLKPTLVTAKLVIVDNKPESVVSMSELESVELKSVEFDEIVEFKLEPCSVFSEYLCSTGQNRHSSHRSPNNPQQ